MINKKKIIFWGSPKVSKVILEKLYSIFNIVAIVTQPDKPFGRKRILKPTCVKHFALEKNIPVFTPEKFNNELFLLLKKLKSDFSVVIAYGNIIPKEFLDIPKNGSINIHYSLLPELRGPSPISYAFLWGKQETGVTIIQMNEKMDNGDILKQSNLIITDNDDYFTIERKLTEIAIKDIIDVIQNYGEYYKNKQKQIQKLSSYTSLIYKEDARINWYDTNINIFNKIRAFTEWPQTFTFLKGKRLKIIQASLSNIVSNSIPGTVFQVNKKGIFVACGEGSIVINRLKPEGKNEQDAFSFFCGNDIEEGTGFEMIGTKEIQIPLYNTSTLNSFDTITIHHTNSYNFHTNSKEIFDEIKQYHKVDRQWDDIGYHFVIGKNGVIFKGRELKKEGAHVKGHNERNMGIALIGDFNLQIPNAKQLGSLLMLIKNIKKTKDMRILGHRDFLNKKIAQCPGDLLYNVIGKFNDRS